MQQIHEPIESRIAARLETTFGRWGASIHAIRIRSDRKRAIAVGIFRTTVALGVLIGGWLLPVSYINRDPTMRTDPDLRIGPGILFSILIGFVYSILAWKSFYRAKDKAATRRDP
jgi:hypothetical protein